jgi:hypothetical protein
MWRVTSLNNIELKWAGMWDKDGDLKKLRFQNGDTIANVDGYFMK